MWITLLLKHHIVVRHRLWTVVPDPGLIVWRWVLEVVLGHASLHTILLTLQVSVIRLLSSCCIHAILTPFIRQGSWLRRVVLCVFGESYS